MSDFYDRAGNPLSFDEWSHTFKAARTPDDQHESTRYVGHDKADRHYISTVWLGLDHSLGVGPPLIFETMIFCHHEPPCDLDDWQERYSTEQEAEAGHAATLHMVAERERLV